MTLVSGHKWLLDAKKRKYAIPQFNVLNLEMVDAVISAAEETNSPVIVGVVDKHFPSLDVNSLVYAIKRKANYSKNPIILHLDHGNSFKRIMEAIQLGFSSVMFDGSLLPIDENIYITKYVKECAKPLGISVEAEIGHVGRGGDGNKVTSVEEAVKFAKETNVDYLAVSIGNTHGHMTTSNFNFDVLKNICQSIDTPIVLHGGSDITGNNIDKLIDNGISKVNIFSDFANSYFQGVNEWGKNEEKDYLGLTHYGRNKSKELVLEKLKLFKTIGKAEHGEFINQ